MNIINSKPLKIRFVYFGQEQQRVIDTLLQILKSRFLNSIEIIKDRNSIVDLEIYSNFRYSNDIEKNIDRFLSRKNMDNRDRFLLRKNYGFNVNMKKRSRKKMWISGENIRPMRNVFDLTLSFDPTDYTQRNIYFPFWFHNLNWSSNLQRSNGRLTVNQCISLRSPVDKTKMVCSFSSYKDPLREHHLRILSRHYQIDKFGLAYRNYVRDKTVISADYLLQYCPENTLYPGYVTEKIFEAWNYFNVPIWIGIDSFNFVNQRAIIDLTLKSDSEISGIFEGLSLDKIYEMQCQPILKKTPDLDSIKNRIFEFLEL